MKGSRLRSLAAASLGIAALALAGCGGGGGGGGGNGSGTTGTGTGTGTTGGGQTITVTGSVIEQNTSKPPANGAVVVVQGTSLSGTVNSTTGQFSIPGVPVGQVTLEVHETCATGPLFNIVNANGASAWTTTAGNVGTINLNFNTFPPPPPFGC